MTLGTTSAAIAYRGDGGTREFPVTLPFIDVAHLFVYGIADDGSEQELANGPDYEWVLQRDEKRVVRSATLKMRTAPAHGRTLEIRRLVPLTQECVFTNQGPNSPRITEEALDRLTMIAQQLDRGLETVDSRVDSLEGGPCGPAAYETLRAEVRTLAAAKADARHAATHGTAGTDPLAPAAIGAVAAADPRLADARTPKAHASTHRSDGSDPLTPVAIGAVGQEHVSASDPHPQYAMRGGDSDTFFQVFWNEGSVRMRPAVWNGVGSPHFERTATGIALKGAI